ncbi:hypothetical protein IKF03_03100 [Candidatus Saccharibacteria bacterium]|nr:hypothetical protein [Candidatus Saccharibacteria bacterium]
MSKQYMDFAPRKGAVKRPVASKPVAKKPVERKPVERKPVVNRPVARKPIKRAEEPMLGVIEEIGEIAVEETTSTATKAKKPADKVFKMPKPNFINQDKVVKRPLSKNVYRKKVSVPPKEEPKGPVTIITKPEKQAHVSLIITIILTIILGAAAGTVAFLLLPK